MFSAALLYLVAILIGSWRQTNILIEAKNPYGVASLWLNPAVKTGTWITVAVFSVWSCFAFSESLQRLLGELIGEFLFGVLLVARWILSIIVASLSLQKTANLSDANVRQKEKASKSSNDPWLE